MTYLIISLLIMALVSVLPRVLPLVLIRGKIKSRFIKSFLFYMPYAVLSALTFPAIFYSTGNIVSASIATAISLVASLFIKNKFYIVAVIGVLTVLIVNFAI